MNKYFLMMAAAGLIAAAPAYYAFQAQAEEAPMADEAAPTVAEEASIDGEAPMAPEGQEPAAGNPEAGEAPGTNE